MKLYILFVATVVSLAMLIVIQVGQFTRKTNEAQAAELALCESRRVHIITTGEYLPLGTEVVGD